MADRDEECIKNLLMSFWRVVYKNYQKIYNEHVNDRELIA